MHSVPVAKTNLQTEINTTSIIEYMQIEYTETKEGILLDPHFKPSICILVHILGLKCTSN